MATAHQTTVELPLLRSKCTVTLHPPSADAECPIMQEPIASAVLQPFPRPYLADKPTHTAMTLQCNHTFHAMALVYHWARNRNVLCPVCRTGPKQRLVVGRLPKEWRYSMAARVRRQQMQDRAEEEQHNHQVAVQLQGTVSRFELSILIEAEAGVSPPTWTLRTQFVPLADSMIFVVPVEDLRQIPYTHDTVIRLIPYTELCRLRPSNWFKAGHSSPGNNFTVNSDERGFHHMHLFVSEDLFAMMVADAFAPSGGRLHMIVLSD